MLLTVYNRKEKTLNCLNSLFENKIAKDIYFDVFLTDDGSTDGTVEAVKVLYPKVNILSGDGTLFWNRGMYKAWQEAVLYDKFDFFLWLNDDTILKSDAIERLLRVSKNFETGIIIGSTSEFGTDDRVSYGGRKFERNYPLIQPDKDKVVSCDTFNGNIVLIPNEVQKRIGILDPYFRHSFGDIEYGLRARLNGVSSYIAPGVFGYCSRDKVVPIFRKKGVSLIKRYQLLYSPLGFNPKEDFYLNIRYFPLYKSIYWFIKLHINVWFTK